MITRYLLVLLCGWFLLVFPLQVAGQFTPAKVEISDVKEVVGGKTFYLHTVKENQTLFGIARKYGVTTSAIIEANPNLPEISQGINIGQVIRIPESATVAQAKNVLITQGRPNSTSEAPSQVVAAGSPIRIEISSRVTVINGVEYYIHTVEQGHTLFSIGRAYRVSTIKIAEANPYYPELLKGINVGQELLIPKGQHTPQPTPPITIDTPWPVGLMTENRMGSGETDCRHIERNQQINVALLIPLFLDRFDGNSAQMQRDHASFTFLPYYQGVLIALDSISRKGANITLHTYDLGRETEMAREIIQKPEMSKMDLIIGPFYKETLNIVVQFAMGKGISVVSPLLPGNDQLVNNPNLFQAVPSTQNQLVKLAGFLRNRYWGQNIILVHNNVSEAIPLIRDFKEAMSPQQVGINGGGDFRHGYFMNGTFVGSRRIENPAPNQPLGIKADSSKSLKEVILGQDGTVAQIISLLDPNKNNIIVALVGNEVVVSNMMRELSSRSAKNPAAPGTFDIMLIGPSRWEEFQTIDLRLFESLNVHILSTDFVDKKKIHNRNFSRRFRNVFLEPPNIYAFWGAQTSYLFFDLLNKYGRDFATCIERSNDSNIPLVPFERFGSKENGWINSNLILFKFNDLEKRCALGN